MSYKEALELKTKEVDEAYGERNKLVALLSKLFPSWISKHEDKENDCWCSDWKNVVFIQLPTGQVSWHIHDSEVHLFKHLPHKENIWDGHSKEAKYSRIKAIIPVQSSQKYDQNFKKISFEIDLI